MLPAVPCVCHAVLSVLTGALSARPAAPAFAFAPCPAYVYILTTRFIAMTEYLRHRVAMLHATLAHFDEFPDRWAGIEDIEDAVQAVREGTAAIEGHARTQAAATPEGITKNHEAARDRAEVLLASLGRRVGPYATRIGDADLREAVAISRARWDAMAEEDFFNRADDTLARTDAVLADLKRVRVTRQDLDAVREALATARPLAATRDTERARRVKATAALGGGYSTVVGPLDILDNLVPELVDDADFVARYRIVRRITDA